MHQFISGTFDEAATANKAVDEIIALDYPPERITIIMSKLTRNRFWSQPTPDVKQKKNATGGTAKGQASGDPIGAIVDAGESDRFDVASVGTARAATRLFVAGPAAVALASEGVADYTPSRVLRTLARFGMPGSTQTDWNGALIPAASSSALSQTPAIVPPFNGSWKRTRHAMSWKA